MPARWREDFDAGRQRVRAALEGRGPQARPRRAGREEPFINAVLYTGTAAPETNQTGADQAAIAAEIQSLRALLGELSEVAEASVARTAELEQQLTDTHWRAERLAEVLCLPGVRRTLFKMAHPDANPAADEAERTARTEATSKINVAYDLIDATKATTP